MKLVSDLIAAFPKLSMEHVNALIALGALGVAVFAIHAVLVVVKELRKR